MPLVPLHQCPADTLQACSLPTTSPLLTPPWLAAGQETASCSLSSTPDLCLGVAVHHPCTHGRPARSSPEVTWEMLSWAWRDCAQTVPGGSFLPRPTRCQAGSGLSPDQPAFPESPSPAPHPPPLRGQSLEGDVGRALPSSLGKNKVWTSAADSCPASQPRGRGSVQGPSQGSPQGCPAQRGGRGEERSGPAHRAGILLGNPIRSVGS